MKKNHFISSAIFCLILFLMCVFKPVGLVAQVPFPGKVIAASSDPVNFLHASPGITVLPDGTYVASHDWSGSGVSGIHTSVYRSTDQGENWELAAVLRGLRWASVFHHNGSLYLLGVVAGWNNIVIRKSDDGGYTWTQAEDDQTGVLFVGSYHTAPTPVVVHNGRIWKAYEESPAPNNQRDFYALVISAPVGADLLKASSWTRSTSVALNPSWFNADTPEWCEGNVVVAPDNKIVNIIRMKTEQAVNGTLAMNGYATGIPRYEVAAKLDVSNDGLTTSFNPSTGFIHFPGAMTKFTIRYDAVSGKYWSIVNKITNVFSGWGNASVNGMWNQRNVLMLTSSTDLVNWEEHYKVIRWNEGDIITRRVNFGFQYVDWQFDGNDIVAVSRTSWYGADWHDANLLTFHRLTDFRNLTMANSPPDIGHLTEPSPAVLSWQFSSPATAGSENTANSTYTHPNLNVSVLSRGGGLNASGFIRSFNSTSGTQHNSKANAISRNEYIQFEVQAKPGHSVTISSVSAKFARTSTGPRSYRWAFSKDGVNFTEIGTGEVFGMVEETEGSIQPHVRLESYKELHNVPSSVKVTFRMYIWGSTNSSGRFSIGRYASGNTTPSLMVGGEVVETPEEETPLANWSFATASGTTPNNTAAEALNENMLTAVLTRGAGFSAASLNIGYYSTLSAITKNEAIAGNAFYKITVQAKSGHYVSLDKLVAKLRRNSTGPVAYRWYYSLDDITYQEIGNSDIPFLDNNGDGVMQVPLELSGIADLQNVSSTQAITFRLYAWGASASTGGFGFGRYTGGDCIAVYGATNDNVITAWRFEDAAITGREVSSNATTVNSNLEQSVLTRGNNVSATSGSTYSFAGNFPVTTTKQQALDAGNYFQFIVKPKSGYKVSLSTLDARLRVQENAPHYYCWRYSTDGVNFYDAGPAENTINTTVNNGQAVPQINLSGYSDLQNVEANKTITFRIYAWGGTATSDNSFGIGKSLSGANALIIGGAVEESEEPLPVTWNGFSAEKEANTVKLKWTTLSENSNSHFNIMRSLDGNNFTVLGMVPANTSYHYNYTDKQPFSSYNYYQLQQVDINGKTDLSEIISINFSFGDEKFKVYAPHDAYEIILFITSDKAATKNIRITDISGRELLNTSIVLDFGDNIIKLPLMLAKGIYLAELENEVIKFAK